MEEREGGRGRKERGGKKREKEKQVGGRRERGRGKKREREKEREGLGKGEGVREGGEGEIEEGERRKSEMTDTSYYWYTAPYLGRVTLTVPTGNTSILFPQNLLLILASIQRHTSQVRKRLWNDMSES